MTCRKGILCQKLTDTELTRYSPPFIYNIKRYKQYSKSSKQLKLETYIMAIDNRHYNLNSKQIHILQLLYKFRFITSTLLATYKKVDKDSLNKTLKILVDQEYIGKRYSTAYKLQGRGAEYYLAIKGLRYLKENFDYNPLVLHSMYKNKSVTDAFIIYHLDVIRCYLAISASQPDTFRIYTKYELDDPDKPITEQPDLYIERVESSETLPNEYVLDLIGDEPFFVTKKRINNYIDQFEQENNQYPHIILVSPNGNIENKINMYIETTLDSIGITEMTITSVNLKSLIDFKNTI